MRDRRRNLINIVRDRGIWLLVLALVAWLCKEVWGKEAFSFDRPILLWIHQFANPQLDRVMLAITHLGDPPMMVMLFAITIARMSQMRRYVDAVRMAIAGSGGAIGNQAMKLFFAKQRPELWPRLIVDNSFSFPSGHAFGSIVMYGFIAYLLAGNLPAYRRVIYSVASILILTIGLSRLYLGVHYPTDIIAGYGIGCLWLNACLQIKWRSSRS